MPASERTQNKKMVRGLQKLDLTRREIESSVMFGGEDPTDKICADLRLQYNESRAETELLCNSHRGSFLRRALSRLPCKSDADMTERVILLGRLQRIEMGYKNSSKVRLSFEVITTLAFMKSPPVPTDTYRHVASTKWAPTFKLLQLSDPSIWKVLGYVDSDFQAWWRSRQSFAELKDTVEQEWKDMKALCGGIVFLLEYAVSSELSGTSLDPYFNDLSYKFRLLGCNLFQLIEYPEHFASVSELFGYSAPIVHVALKCLEKLRASFDEERRSGISNLHLAAKFYKRQVVCLDRLIDALLGKSEDLLLKADSSLKDSTTESGTLKTITGLSITRLHGTEDLESQRAALSLSSLTAYNLEALKDLGLREVQLSAHKGRQIGFGSFSIVFERVTPDGTRRFAVKEPTGKDGLDHDAIWNRVAREAQIWRLLKHENIHPLHGVCLLPDDLPALVMDPCHWNLKEFIQMCPATTEKKKLELLRGVACGLAHIHSQKIAHGDLRASNVLVKENDANSAHKAVLIDFGIAYFVDGGSDPVLSSPMFETTLGQVGNPNWLSPELLRKAGSRDRGDAAKQDRVCISIPGDIYSFGCVFLEVIFERDPHQSFHTEEQKKAKKLEGHLPATLEETNATYFPFLRSLWNPDPNCRPSAVSVIRQLDDFLEDFTP